MKRIVLLTTAIILSLSTNAQRPGGGRYNMANMPKEGIITGKIIDQSTDQPMEYANVVIYSKRDSSLVGGTISNPDGSFKIEQVPYGRFYMTANFIGYNKVKKDSILILPRRKEVDVGDIILAPVATEIEGVVVKADKSPVNYKLDKKVINVSQDINSRSGTAIDVLQNVPSVTVDIEGNVTMRGSSNFTVLIDGKPSTLDGNDALQQIPAGTIDNIEIITNPSAKYDPDGVGGIINVVLKKQKLAGISGLLNLSAGTGDKYRGDVLLNYRTSKMNIYGGVDYNNFNFGGTQESYTETYRNDSTTFRNTSGSRDFVREGLTFKGGVDFYLNDNNTLSLGARGGNYGFVMESMSEIQNYLMMESNSEYSLNENISERSGKYYNIDLNFDHQFSDPGHKLTAMAYYSFRGGDDESEQNAYTTDNNFEILPGDVSRIRNNTEDGRDQFRFKLDYVKPFTQKSKLESGYQSRLSKNDQEYFFYDYDNGTNEWILNDFYTNSFNFSRNIHALYTTYSNEILGIGYQLGLRGEYTDREIENIMADESYVIDRFDFFPTLHLSKQINETNQIMASYSRRINRPRGFFLDPVESYMDEYNIRKGNPALEPEYIDSYELGYQKSINRNFINLEGYYRVTQNGITRITELNEDDIFVQTFDNLSSEYALGAELMVNAQLFKWFRLNASANVYDYRIEGGVVNTTSGENRSTNWDFRANGTIMIKDATRVQLSSFYRSPSISAQGEREGFMSTSLAIRQDFFSGKLSTTLQVQDIFSQMQHEFTNYGDNYYAFNIFQRETPIVNLTLSYKINNYKQQMNRQNSGLDDVEMDMGY